jgi:PAS domain-containing protein
MQPVLKDLINKHLKTPDDLPPDVTNFLEALQQVGLGTGSGTDIDSILESMPFGITLIDKQKNIRYANEGALNLMGYDSLESIVGHLCHDTL